MASSLLNKLKLIAGESIDTIDPTNPDNPNQALIDRYKNVPGINVEKLTEYLNLNIPEPQTVVDAMLLAEAVGYTPEQAKVVGAQWVLESGRGVNTAGADYNYFGVKSHSKAAMKRMSEKYGIDVTKGANVNTAENAADGSRYTENTTFASFKNPIEGFLGKKAFLETNSRYEKALNPENTADEFAQGLQDAGYATVSDDQGNLIYKKKLAEIYNGPMRTTRPEWMEPTRKSNVPQKEWTMTAAQPTEGSRAELIEQKKSTSKNPIIAEYENFILAPEETKEWWYNIYKDDLESGKITEAELDKQIAIDKKEKNLKFQEYQKDPLAYIQNELDYALETREEGDDSYIASLEKVVNAVSPAPEKVEASEEIDLQSAEEMQASIDVNALQEWNNLQKQNWAGVKEWDPKGVEMLKEYNKKMGVNYDPSEAWSAITISNAVMAGSGASNRDEIRAKGFNPSKGHSYYISDAFKTSKNPNYKYNKYKAEKLSGTYNIGDILVKGRKPKEGIDTSKWSYEDFKSHAPGYASHTDIIVDKGTDDNGEYIVVAGGNVDDTYATNKIYVKDIPAKRYKATLRDRAAIKPSFSITPIAEEEEVVTTSTKGYNPFVGEKRPPADAILDDIKYNPKMPRMIGNTQEDINNYLANKKNVEDVALAQLAEEEQKNYQPALDNYEKLAAENAGNEQIFPKVKVFAKKPENKEDEIIPLQKPVEEEKIIDMEYLNSIPDVNSFISPGSFTNESRSKEELKQAAEAEQFIMSPLKRNANSGYFGSGKSMFYPSRRQQKYGGAMAPIIPTYYKSKGTPIYRDTTDAPPRIFENGGSEDEIGKPTNPINTSKGLLGMLGDAAKYSAARKMSKTELPEKEEGMTNYNYFNSLNKKQLASIPYKEQMNRRDVEAENYHVNQVKDNMLKIASNLNEMSPQEDYEYLGVPWMGQQNIKETKTVTNPETGEEYQTNIVDDSSSWFHKLIDTETENYYKDKFYVPTYQTESGRPIAEPYTCIGAYCAIGKKAGARFAKDNKYGKAGESWEVLTGNHLVDDIQTEMGLYAKDPEDVEAGDAVRQGHKDGSRTYHTMLITGKPDEYGTYPTTYGSGWARGVGELSEGGPWANIDWAKYNNDLIVGYEGRLPAMKENLSKAQGLNARYQAYLDQKAIAKMPLKKAELIRTSPVKMPFISRKEYPNTRRGRKQEQQDNAYIEAYMARMQKK